MQIELTEQTLTWQQLVLDYVERELIPWEVTAELDGAELPSWKPGEPLPNAYSLGEPAPLETALTAASAPPW